MFTRAELKQKAKSSIHQNIWICIGITLAYSILIGNSFGVTIDQVTNQPYFHIGLGSSGEVNFDIIKIPLTMGLFGLGLLITLAYDIFIAEPIRVGYARFFLENREAPSKFEVLFDMFSSGIYLNVVKIMLLRSIYTTLWMFLFIFPGIYKAYEYSMIPFILAENPNMESSEVFALTKIMTKDIKFDMFVLDYSFILWHLLTLITLGFATLYVAPYTFATQTELYCFLRDEQLQQGNIVVEEEEYVEPTIDDLH